MRFGASVWLDRPARDTAAIAAAAEEAGFDTLWVPDHYFLRDSFVALTLAAEATERIRLGTSVVSPLLRHPTLLASSFGTVHEVSGGRAVVGIGTGGAEFPRQLGLPIRRPLSLVRETVEIIAALSAGRADLSGKHFVISGAEMGWQPGAMPVYLAARGPKMLELSGEISDGVITHGLAPSHIEFVRERVAAGEAKTGRKGACGVTLMFDYEHDENREAALERLRPRCTYMVAGSYSESLIPVYGLNPDQVVPIREVVGSGDLDGAVGMITPEMVEAFTVGGPESLLLQRLEDLGALGVDGVILSLGGDTVDESIARIRRAGRVIAQMP